MLPARSAFPRAPPRNIRPRRSRTSPPRWRTGAIAEATLIAEAAEWHARLDRPGGATHAGFEAWRNSSPAHADAYDRVCAAHAQAQANAAQAPLLALRQQTLARTMLARPPVARWRIAAAVALVAAGTPLAAFGIRAWTAAPTAPAYIQTFRTGIGQQADVTLRDGTSVTLDTASTLKVRLDSGTRQVTLDGQGWFEVKPGDAPFRISAGGRDFIARAGTYDVRTDPDRVRAFAASGGLTLQSEGSSIALAPGKLLAVQARDVMIRTLDNPAAFTGWRGGMLQFDDTPLAEAVGELNRYNARPIRLADPQAGALRVSGAFRTTGAPAFIGALTAGFPVRVKHDAQDGIVIASR